VKRTDFTEVLGPVTALCFRTWNIHASILQTNQLALMMYKMKDVRGFMTGMSKS
jgi:hypothetical protein